MSKALFLWKMKFNQFGAAPILILVAIIGVVVSLAISSSAPFRNNLLSSIFPKEQSLAASGDLAGAIFNETFTHIDNVNQPAPPVPWKPENWNVFSNNTDNFLYRRLGYFNNNPYYMNPMQAHHGADCSKPINDTNPGDPILVTHLVSDTINNVFLCRNHMMTSVNHEGYGAVYFTPNHMIDFSQGEATFRFDMSTIRTSTRDWVDFWVTPYEDNLVAPIQEGEDPYSSEPRRAIQILNGNCGGNTGCFAFSKVINNHIGTLIRDLPGGNGTANSEASLESALAKHGFRGDAARRDTFELKLSRNHIKFCMTSINTTPPRPVNECFIDHPIPALNWDKGIVQLAQHAYNPTKGSDPSIGGGDFTGKANTWHWDNVYISPAIPFTIINGTPDLVMYDFESKEVTFSKPAPANSFLRFAGASIGEMFQFSTDNGATWITPQQPSLEKNIKGKYPPYWTPIPTGTTKVLFRGPTGWGNEWAVQGMSIWSLTAPSTSSPVPTSPSPSPSSPQSPSPSPIPSASAKPGDIDGNNKVDIFDYNILLTNFGKTDSGFQGDFDNNGRVDIFDFNILLTNFGK